jgi:hypothetical protein
VGTDSNIADPMTKHLAREKHESFLSGLGIFPAHLVVPAAYAVQKQEKLNVLKDITLVQAGESWTAEQQSTHSVIAAIYGEDEDTEQPSSWTLQWLLFWALVGFLRTALDVCRKLSKMFRKCPQEVANRVDLVEVGVGTSDVSSAIDSDDHRSGEGTTTVMRFTTVTRHAPIWHSVGGERYHCSADCRGLRGAMGIKKKTQCLICGDGAVTSTSTRPTDWEM